MRTRQQAVATDAAGPLLSRPVKGLAGEVRVPGDKSISHRALMLGALAVGETRISGLLEAEDVLGTADAMRALGADVSRADDGTWRVFGRGVGGLAEPDRVIDLGNSGTSARLLAGILAAHPFTCFLTGDESLRRRPMGRIMEPLRRVGAVFTTRSGDRLPMAVTGTAEPLPIDYTPPVASAQVKSAVLLAGLHAPGQTRVTEPRPTRDHTERMLAHFGATVVIDQADDGARSVTLTGQPELSGARVDVPGDVSAAAFPLVAATLVPGSRVVIRGVGMNPLRRGLIDTLLEMGAAIRIEEIDAAGDEPAADLVVEHAPLGGVEVPPERAPAMIDEYPILAIAAACADGVSRFHGLGELRVKESDRLRAVVQGLAAAGVRVEEWEDGLAVHGSADPPPGNARIAAALDHRIAMAFLILGMAARAPVGVDDGRPIATSFPGFTALLNGLGADITPDRAP